jgi:2-oxoacid:acceptor oxidoreductase gamma subunit (pyruvate/2-ketoisovalerate family)
MEILDLQVLLRTGVLEIRGDGKAGGGLILAFQSLASLLLKDPGLHVQEWPFFSSARRGANIRSFMRVSARPITAACEVTRPTVVLLMNESAARSVDFAEGVPHGGTFVINSRHSPEECAAHFQLSGRVVTVPGDEIGLRYLKASIGNVSTYVALAQTLGGLEADDVVGSFLALLAKRRIPEGLIARNREALEASAAAVRTGTFDFAHRADHQLGHFTGYGQLPVGAQSPLRLSLSNRTAGYAPSGFRLRFEDPADACTGCAHCITNCPEGIIHFVPDEQRVLKVTGVDVSTYCKLCGECIAICPEKLFQQLPFEEVWETAEEPIAP